VLPWRSFYATLGYSINTLNERPMPHGALSFCCLYGNMHVVCTGNHSRQERPVGLGAHRHRRPRLIVVALKNRAVNPSSRRVLEVT
jgi:hypothetical protein